MSNEYFHEELGGLWGNFLSLDAVLRGFQHRLPNAKPIGIPHGMDVYSYPVGTEFPISPLANMEFFSSLVESYNKEAVARGLGSPIDASLVVLRNALAHGFVSTDVKEGPMRLLKFGPSRPGFVKITVNETMDLAWFKAQKRRVFDAIHTVHTAEQKLAKPNPTHFA